MKYVYRRVFSFEDVNGALEDIEASLNENDPSNVPSFLNSWVEDGTASYLPCGFWKTLHGIVILEGRIKNGTIGLPAFTLPPYYRPEGHIILSVASNNLYGQVRIESDGDVIPLSPSSNTWVSLSGISFRAKREQV
jgi:hypothetical protein